MTTVAIDYIWQVIRKICSATWAVDRAGSRSRMQRSVRRFRHLVDGSLEFPP
jgi:hypothetical protein